MTETIDLTKLDPRKIRFAIKETHETKKVNTEIFFGKKMYMDWDLFTTILYSLKAHSHGKLHIKKRWESTFKSDGLQTLMEKTMEDQAKLISPYASLFLEGAVEFKVPDADSKFAEFSRSLIKEIPRISIESAAEIKERLFSKKS
jgi:hypothetical protein